MKRVCLITALMVLASIVVYAAGNNYDQLINQQFKNKIIADSVFGFYTSSTNLKFTKKYLVQTADPALPNAQAMGALSTGIVKNTTTTGVQSIAIADADYVAVPTFTNYTTAAHSRFDSTFITQTANPNLPNSQAMGALSTGIVKNTTTTGVQVIASPVTDYVSGYAGLLAQPTITDNGDGTITVGTGSCMLYDNADGTGGAKYYTVTGGTFIPVDNASNVLTIEYSGGSAIYGMSLQSAFRSNYYSIIPVITLYRSGTNIDTISWDATAQALPEKALRRIIATQRFARESGLILGEAATRYITVTSGLTWNGVTQISLDAANSSTDSTTLWYHVSGVYTSTPITQYNNTQYDDGTDIVTLTNNRYAVNWIYRQEDTTAELHVVLGGGDYSLPAAQVSQPPSTLPDIIRANSILVGRIIVEKAATTATTIDSSFTTTFTPAATTSHADLTELDYASAGHTGFIGNTGNTAALDMGIYGITAASLTDSGNLTFTGSGSRITGDFSNATLTNRTAFQSSTTNGATAITTLPNGTSTTSRFASYNAADPTNCAFTTIAATSTVSSLTAGASGTGTGLPLTFSTTTTGVTSAERMRILTGTPGNILMGATTETAGAEKLQVTGAISASGAVLVGGGANTVYYCDAGTSVGNLCRGNGCSCVGGTWIATSLKID